MLVISPHFDDAVLSCWHLLDGEEDVQVVNVFSGSPPSGTPAGWWDKRTGAADPAMRVAERRREDEAARAVAGVPAVELDFLDAQHRDEALAPAEIEARLRELASEVLVAPMGLDGHDDHALARDAALALSDDGAEVILYADLPHATKHGWPRFVENGSAGWQEILRSVGVDPDGLRLETHRLSPAAIRRKRSALSRYDTQLDALAETYASAFEPEVLGVEAVWRG